MIDFITGESLYSSWPMGDKVVILLCKILIALGTLDPDLIAVVIGLLYQ